MDHRHDASRSDWVLIALLTISLFTNVVFGVFLLRSSGRSPSPFVPQALSPGTRLPSLEGLSLTGSRQVVDFAGATLPTLLYVYSPSCAWCARNLENVKAVFASTRSSHRIVALSLAPEGGADAETLQQYGQVLLQPTRTVFEAYRMGPTPMTVVISPTGTVLAAWTGAYVGRTREEVERHFAVRLPGVLPGAKDVSDNGEQQ